jgi:hypothetical protein
MSGGAKPFFIKFIRVLLLIATMMELVICAV